MASYTEVIPSKNKGVNQTKNSNSEQASVDPLEDGRNYCIGRLNLGEAATDSENESK